MASLRALYSSSVHCRLLLGSTYQTNSSRGFKGAPLRLSTTHKPTPVSHEVPTEYKDGGVEPLPNIPFHIHEASIVDPHKGKVASPDVSMPDDLGHAVGKERYELLCKLYGINDPYYESVIPRAGTWTEPHLVPSFDWRRPVWCQCKNTEGMYWYKHTAFRGIPTRCECGHYFKLVTPEIPDFVSDEMRETLLGFASDNPPHH